jgi:hypothetical protein
MGFNSRLKGLTPTEIQCTQREKASHVLSTQSLSTQVPTTAYTIKLNSVTMRKREKSDIKMLTISTTD